MIFVKIVLVFCVEARNFIDFGSNLGALGRKNDPK